MRQGDRAPFDRALHRARASAYAPGEFVGQEGFMTAGEIRALAVQAGLHPSPEAPVWPMSAFRDRFLTAFG